MVGEGVRGQRSGLGRGDVKQRGTCTCAEESEKKTSVVDSYVGKLKEMHNAINTN